MTHCSTCGVCYNSKRPHHCGSQNDCSVCMETMQAKWSGAVFTSLCGHVLHHECALDMFKHSLFACPVCRKAMIHMKHVYAIYAATLKKELFGAPITIYCNDCSRKCTAPRHPGGVRCIHCAGFNTVLS